MVVDSAPGGLMGWVQQYGQYVLFFAQLLYWLVLCVAAVWATLLFRRLVNFRTISGGQADAQTVAPETAASPGTAASSGSASSTETQVSVDEFVE